MWGPPRPLNRSQSSAAARSFGPVFEPPRHMPLTEKQKIDAALTRARTELAQSAPSKGSNGDRRAKGRANEKSFVSRQAHSFFATLRASILAFPAKYSRHVVGISDEHRAREILTKAAHEFLAELANFDEKSIDPPGCRPSKATARPHPLLAS